MDLKETRVWRSRPESSDVAPSGFKILDCKHYLITQNALLHWQVLGCFLFAAIVYYVSGQPSDVGRFSMFFVISLFVVYVAMSFGLMIGAIFDVVVSQTVLVPKHNDMMTRCQVARATNLVRWRLLFAGPQYWTCFMSPLGACNIGISERFMKNLCMSVWFLWRRSDKTPRFLDLGSCKLRLLCSRA